MSRRKTQKKPNDAGLITSGIIFIIIGLVFAFMGVKEMIGVNGDLIDMNTASASDLKKGDYVEIDITYADYSYCENVQTTNYVFKRTTDQYYLISALADDSYFMGIKVAESQKDDLENLSKWTWNETDVNPGPLHYKGKLCESNSELHGYMRDYFYEMMEAVYGASLTYDDKTQLDSYMLPYYIEIITPSSYMASIGVGGGLAIIGIIFLIVGLIKKKNAVVTPEMPVTPYTDTFQGAADAGMNNAGMDTYGMNNAGMDTYGMNNAGTDSAGMDTNYTPSIDDNSGIDSTTFEDTNNTSSFNLKQ